MNTVIDLGDLGAWPATAATPVASVSVEQQYHESSISGVVERAAASLQEWSEPALAKTASAGTIWKDPEAHPVVLALRLLDRYGQEYLEWDPEVLRLTLDREGIKLSNAIWTKILAARVVISSPSPWRQWEVFHWVSRGLGGLSPNFYFLEEPELGHLMLGIDVMRLFDPQRVISTEVDKFVAAVLKNEGCCFAPPPLDFAQRELESPKLDCEHCGAQHRDDADTKCVTCGSTALVKVPYEFEELKQRCADLWAARFKLPLEKALEGLPEDAAGNQVYHLLVHWDYARRMRQLLLHQLRALE